MSKKIQRPINPRTGKEFTRTWAYRKRHPEVAEAHKIKMRIPEALEKSSIRTLRNKEHLRKVKLAYYHKNKQKIAMRNKMTRSKVKNHANYAADYYVPLKDKCEICSSSEKLERHHWNYDKPLLVSTLCRTCRKIQHLKDFARWHKCKLETDKQLEVVA